MSSLPPNETPIAVVGLGCRLPGADSLDDYWTLIRDGRSGIIELPPEKIDCDLYYDPEPGKLGRSYTKLGGVVFDRPINPDICRLSKRLVDNADSAHLIMCEVAAMALRHAGYDPHNHKHPNTGVYIGHSGGSALAGEMACHVYTEEVVPYLRESAAFQALPADQQLAVLQGIVDRVHRTTATRNADGGPEVGASNVSALISQAFGFSGPALATDAACASSLIAMAMGIQALRQGHIDMAVVGGASCSKWYALVLFSQAKSISGTGSRPFDANADGLISSDGYAAVVLKTLPRALKDGDNIRAVIRGIGVSSDGRGKSLWAPRKEGQILAVNRAYGKNIDPAWLQYVECHATSTQVGDSTELGALNLAFKGRLPADRKLPIGSVKANIGHTLESAGIAGFLKAALCMQNRTIPGQINFQTPNPDVPWNDLPFYVNTETHPWPEPVDGRPRRTAVNAFGIGGLNVHVVMDDRIVERTKAQALVPAVPSEDDRAIAIIGAAAVLPGALTMSAYWDLLVSGRDPKVDVPGDRWSPEIYFDPSDTKPCRTPNKRGGFITDFVYDWKKHKVPPKQIANANPLQFMLLDAADQALRDAGYDKKEFDRQRACVIVGSVYGGDFACEMQMGLRIPEFQKHIRDELRSRGVPEAQVEAVAESYQDLLLKHMPALLDETGSFTASTLASRLTKTFDLMGGAFSIDANDVSSMAAVAAAVGMLQDGGADMVLCSACQRSMDVNVFEGLNCRDSLAKGDPKPSFTKDFDGLVPGEGAGVLILKRLSDARRDGDPIRGVIRGIGSALHHEDPALAYREAFQKAVELGNSQIDHITAVETACSGKPQDDHVVIETLHQLLDSPTRSVPAVVGSVASQIGHTLGLSGIASVLKAVVELEHGEVPATAGFTQPIPELQQHADTLKPANQKQPLYATTADGKTLVAVTNGAPNGAVMTCLIEGGQKLAPVPKKAAVQPQARPVTATAAATVTAAATSVPAAVGRTIRMSAASRTDLPKAFAEAQARAGQLFENAATTSFTPGAKVQVAIVSAHAEGLEKQLRLAHEHLARSENLSVLDDKGIFVREVATTATKVAFLFPGQGSQYAGMLRSLVESHPAAGKLLQEIDQDLVAEGCPTFEQLAWVAPEKLGADVFVTQLSMLVANTLSYRVLTTTGLRPDVISCHSYGEFPALVAAGVLTLREAIRATRDRTRSVETRESTKGCLLSSTAPLELVEKLLKQLPVGAYLASHNAPDQTVIGGTADAVQGLRRLLEAEGFATRALAVPRPYHTPLLQEAQPAFAAALQHLPLRSPQLRMVSSVSLQDVRSGDQARKNLVDQLVMPVRYVQLVQQLADEGVSVFIEVGPNRVLSRLNQRILAGRKASVVPMDVPQQPGTEGLLRIEALMQAVRAASQPAAPVSKILFFDATQQRRSRTTVATRSTEAAAQQVASPEPAPAVARTEVSVVTPVVAEAAAAPALDRAEVARFMINYVVDQTGYPAEMVEMTADLEADLGIDSIKKAQLIGELSENFELSHLAGSLQDLSLDDFRTLDSLLAFVTNVPANATASTAVAVVSHSEASTDLRVSTPAAAIPVVTATVTSSLDRDEVAKFMINYVVDQTGYPAEMVEMTADLEADLGIDSIKKAQLIGELSENFELSHLAGSLQDLSLDDFRTLDSLLDFVTKVPAGAATAAPVVTATVIESTAVVVSAPVAAVTVSASSLDRDEVAKFMVNYVVDQTGYPAEMVEMTADLEADLGIDSIKKAQLIGELSENFELSHLASSLQDLSLDDFRTLDSLLDFVTKVPAAGALPAPVVAETAVVGEPVATAAITEVRTAAPAIAVVATSLDRGQVAKFMVNYVVDQTGYPEEMVEMTADLEADLGIDSIKKAQLIGELAENFELSHLAGSLQELSLDDFRTLDSLLDFVTRVPAGAAVPAIVAEPAAESTSVVDNDVVIAVPAHEGTSLDRDRVAKFMVNYVVDQTGYPEEMVEMTADLEADLGIDSIKKAQLIGELAENFELSHLAGSLQELSLDDFRTLDSLLDFVTRVPAEGTSAQPAVALVEPAGAVAVAEVEPRVEVAPVATVTTATPQAATLPEAFSVVTLAGTPYEMGFQHGQSKSAAILQIMERYAAMLGPRLQNIPELEQALAKPTMYFGETELQELQGIADGAGLPMPAVLAHNLGMYPDYVPGCTQFAFTKRSNPRYGLIHAVNEDSPLSLTLPDCLSRVVQIRRPKGGIPHVTFSVSGQTGGLNGMNAAGLAITSTLLLDCPRRKETAIGKVHPVVVKRLLEHSETIEDALRLLRTLDRAGAWSLCLSEHRNDRLCYLEYDGGSLEVQEQPTTVLTTNHCLLQTPVADIPEHSRLRLQRLQQLLQDADSAGVPLELAQQTLRDRFDLGRGRKTAHATMNTIRRVDNQISIVMLPESGELYITPGPRSGDIIDNYYRLDFKQLLQDAPAAPVEASKNGHHANGAHRNGKADAVTVIRSTPAVPPADVRKGLPAEADRIVQRHVMRMVESPLPAGVPELPKFSGAIAILGKNKLGQAIADRLAGCGQPVHLLDAHPEPEAVVSELERLWQQQPITSLFVVTARDEAAANPGRGNWDDRMKAGLVTPFLVCQKWAQKVQEAKLTGESRLIGVTALGGELGFTGRPHSFEGGGITGLFKGLRRELADMSVKVIDAPLEESPAQLAAAVLQECAFRGGPLESAWMRGKRSVVQAVPQPASNQRVGGRVPHGTWVVTGGARGVTAVVARELGRRFGLTMHLLGSTPQPTIDPSWRNLSAEGLKTLKRTIMDQARVAGKNPANSWKEIERAIEIDRTLQSFRADGVQVFYHACDVADRAALDATLQKVREQSGPIHGVIHGAGLEAACRFDKKKRELVEATLAVKVSAAVHLADLVEHDPLEYFLGFGSTSGRFGGMGQSDYSMASDMLCKFCDALRVARPNVAAIGLHWPPWADVGMAARPESKIALQSSNLAFMPPLEGAAHVLDELLTTAQEGELLFLDKPDLIDTDNTMVTAELRPEYLRRDSLIRSASIVETVQGLQPGRTVTALARFHPTSDPFLLEHRHQGQPILPAVVGMESMAETAAILLANGSKVVGLRNMTVHQGLRFLDESIQSARILAEAGSDGVKCRLEADFRDRHGRLVEPHRLQMDATIELAADYTPLPAVELGPRPEQWTAHRYVSDWRTMKFPEEARVYHGYPFRALQDYALVDGGLWARIRVPDATEIAGDRSAEGWLIPSAVIDSGLLGSDLMIWNTLRLANLPRAFDRIRIARPLRPGESLTMRFWLRSHENRAIRGDFVMVDDQGQVVLQVDGYEMVEVKTGTASAGEHAASPATPVISATSAPAPTVKEDVVLPAGRPAPAPLPNGSKYNKTSRLDFTAVKPLNGHAPAPAPLPGKSGTTAVPIAETTAVPVIDAARIAELPLIDSAAWENADRLVAKLTFDPKADRFVSEHTFSGRPLLPAVVGLESMIEASSLTAAAGAVPVVSGFEIFAPCKFRDDSPQKALVVVERAGEGWTCQMTSDDGKNLVYQSASIAWKSQPEPVQAPPCDKPFFPMSPMQYASKGQAQLLHGPGFQCLKGLSLQREVGWAKVVAAAANNLGENRPGTRWFLPIATLDSCLVACGVDLFILMSQRVEVPNRCEQVRVVRLPAAGENCTLKLFYRGHDDRHTTYDLYLYGQQGDVVLTVAGYRGIRTVKGADASLWNGDAQDRFA